MLLGVSGQLDGSVLTSFPTNAVCWWSATARSSGCCVLGDFLLLLVIFQRFVPVHLALFSLGTVYNLVSR